MALYVLWYGIYIVVIDLYQVEFGARTESVYLTADSLLQGAIEQLSDEEKALRERQRVATKYTTPLVSIVMVRSRDMMAIGVFHHSHYLLMVIISYYHYQVACIAWILVIVASPYYHHYHHHLTSLCTHLLFSHITSLPPHVLMILLMAMNGIEYPPKGSM